MLAPETPICPAPEPTLRTARRSSAWPPAEKSTVNVPVSKFAESTSVTAAVVVMRVAPAFSV